MDPILELISVLQCDVQPPANFRSLIRKLDIYIITIIIINLNTLKFVCVYLYKLYLYVCVYVVLNDVREMRLQIELTMKVGTITEESGPRWCKMV